MTETKRKTWIVDESGAGDYRTLTEAVAACAVMPDEPVRFYIRHGIYEERPFIELADYVIEGEYRNATVITASVGGRDPWPGEVKTGTFRSATLFLGGGRAVVRNLTVQDGEEFRPAQDCGGTLAFPARVLSFLNLGYGMEQILHGSVCLRMQASVGTNHMPESTVLFTILF